MAPVTEIFLLCDEIVERLCDHNPLAATSWGVAGRDHRWPELAPGWYAELAHLIDVYHRRATALSAASPAEEMAQRVLVDRLVLMREEIERHEYRYDLNNIDCGFHSIRQACELMPKDTKDDWSRIVVRLETIGAPLAGYRATLQDGIDHDQTVARRQVLAVIEQGETTAGPASSFVELLEDYDRAGLDDEGLRARVAAAVAGARACYGEFTDWLRDHYLPRAVAADGIGEERYRALARRYLGTDIDLPGTYHWGWSEITSLRARADQVAAQIDPTKSVNEVIELLHTDPARAAPNVAAFTAAMRARQEQALHQLDGVHFDLAPEIRAIDVRAAPAGGSLAAYYTGPSEDFSRPGTIWYPIDDAAHLPYFEQITTAYHEGFPGHHLQVGMQTAMGDALSRFHKLAVWYEGAGEGWALYAERLMLELGYLELPDYEMGWLSAQLLRACRIVFDIGAHLGLPIPADAPFHPGEAWTYDLGVELLTTLAMQAEPMAHSEITRYLGWPAQAITYKVGEKALLDLRTELVAGGHLDQREFHRRVIAAGALGLDHLRELVSA
jgi:uncharacterized protein (DUF885 family)